MKMAMSYACNESSLAGISNGNATSILLGGENPRALFTLQQALREQGFRVQPTPLFDLEREWKRHRHPIILIDVADRQGAETAVNAALEIKRIDPKQFVGYLADYSLQVSAGLAGDAIFPRTATALAEELRRHLTEI